MLQVPCPHCQKVLSVPTQYAGQQGKCNNCGSLISVPPLEEPTAPTESFSPVDSVPLNPEPAPVEDATRDWLDSCMTPEEQAGAGISKLGPEERKALATWALRLYSLGRHVVEDIDEIKYGGRLVILDDGSRWEVDDYDASTVKSWSTLDKVLIVNDEMYNIDGCEKVSVSEET